MTARTAALRCCSADILHLPGAGRYSLKQEAPHHLVQGSFSSYDITSKIMARFVCICIVNPGLSCEVMQPGAWGFTVRTAFTLPLCPRVLQEYNCRSVCQDILYSDYGLHTSSEPSQEPMCMRCCWPRYMPLRHPL